jgi:hypothetical protein
MIDIFFAGLVAISFPSRTDLSSARALMVDAPHHTPTLTVLATDTTTPYPDDCTESCGAVTCKLADTKLTLEGATGGFSVGSTLRVTDYLMDVQAAYKFVNQKKSMLASGWTSSMEIPAGTLTGDAQIPALSGGAQTWEYIATKHGKVPKKSVQAVSEAAGLVKLSVNASGIGIEISGKSKQVLTLKSGARVTIQNDGPGGLSPLLDHYRHLCQKLLGVSMNDEQFLPHELKAHKAMAFPHPAPTCTPSPLRKGQKLEATEHGFTIQHMERCPPAVMYVTE